MDKRYQVTVLGETKEYPEGTPYGEIVSAYADRMLHDVVLVTVNGRLRELHKRLSGDCQLELITTAEPIGHNAYRRSMTMLLLKAVYHVAGHENIRKVVLHFSCLLYTSDAADE